MLKVTGNERLKVIWKQNRAFILERLGGKCVMCGYDADERALQVDHINGGGHAEMTKMSRFTYMNYLVTLPEKELLEKYQLLCANCNCIKRIENNEHRKSKLSL